MSVKTEKLSSPVALDKHEAGKGEREREGEKGRRGGKVRERGGGNGERKGDKKREERLFKRGMGGK